MEGPDSSSAAQSRGVDPSRGVLQDWFRDITTDVYDALRRGRQPAWRPTEIAFALYRGLLTSTTSERTTKLAVDVKADKSTVLLGISKYGVQELRQAVQPLIERLDQNAGFQAEFDDAVKQQLREEEQSQEQSPRGEYTPPVPQKPAAIQPAPSPAGAVLESWDKIGRKLVAVAENFPEDKYDFKPTPAQSSFAELLLHICKADVYFSSLALGKTPPSGAPTREQFKMKSDVVALVKKTILAGEDAVKYRGDKGMNDLVIDHDAGREYRVGDLAYSVIEYDGEQYGQLAVYYRLVGINPP